MLTGLLNSGFVSAVQDMTDKGAMHYIREVSRIAIKGLVVLLTSL